MRLTARLVWGVAMHRLSVHCTLKGLTSGRPDGGNFVVVGLALFVLKPLRQRLSRLADAGTLTHQLPRHATGLWRAMDPVVSHERWKTRCALC